MQAAKAKNEQAAEREKLKASQKALDPNEPIRLNRFIAKSGVCSRRDADALIARGAISVNGQVITEMGHKVTPGTDRVEYQGKTLLPQRNVYILLNKQKNTITTTADEKGRRTVLDTIEKATQERVYPVGRLDRNTTGLLLLTNDGKLAEKMTHPSHQIKKVYKVTLDKPVPEEDLQRLVEGIQLEDGPAKVDAVDYASGSERNVIGVEIHIGRNRIVRRMFEYLGYEVVALDRTMLGPLTKRDLPRGKWRELSEKEVAWLNML